jgi:tRNA A-37 threonylcarbamoyl transferase component Bud32
MTRPLAIEVDPAFAGRVAPLTDALAAGRLPEGAVAVKESTLRTVHRVALAPDLVLFVKRDRPRDRTERAKYAILPSRARAEWRNIGRLRAAGFDVPERALLAERRAIFGLEEAILATRAVEPAAAFYRHLEGAGPAARRAALGAAGALARRLHEAGFFHRDFHGGNLLVREPVPGTDPGAAPGLVLLDLHRLVKLSSVAESLRARDLAIFCHDVREVVGGEGIAAFLEGYGAAPGLVARALAAEGARRRERLRSRGRRCVVRSTGFRIEDRGRYRVFRRADVPLEPILAAIERHRATIEAGPGAPGFVKRDHTTRVSRQPALVAAGEAAGEVAVKEFPEKGLLGAVQHFVRRHRGRQAWLSSHALLLRGLGTPLPLALVEVRRAGLVAGSFLLTRWVADAEDLHLFIDRRFAGARGEPLAGRAEGPWGRGAERSWLGPRGERHAVRAFARFIARLHAEGLYHGDLKLPNVLVRERPARADGTPDLEFLLLDLEALSPAKRLTARRRVKNLAQIEDYARLHLSVVKRSHRARFLDEYGRALEPAAGAAERRRAARWLAAEVEVEVRARAARRASAGAGPARGEPAALDGPLPGAGGTAQDARA